MEKATITAPPPLPEEDEIDLLALAKTFWNGRKTVAIAIMVSGFIGIFVALQSPNVYTASSIMVPQMGEGSSRMGGLGGLAALAGVNLDVSTGADLSPVVYPQIIKSIPFQLELMNTPLNFAGYKQPISLYNYYDQEGNPTVMGTIMKYTIGLPGVLIGLIKGKSKESTTIYDSVSKPIQLTQRQIDVINNLTQLVSLSSNAKEGYLTLTVEMSEPLPAAQLAQRAQDLMQRFITEFKIKKAKNNLDFIQERYNETKIEFEMAQVSLAISSDRNKEFTSGLPRLETERLQSKYALTSSIFQEMAKQLEQAKIQLKKETPVFTIIEPVVVPSERSKPNRSMIVLIWLFLGGVVGTGIVFGKEFIEPLKKKWNE